MKVLHICSYYIGNKLYKNLFSSLNNRFDLKQNVYIPIKNKNLINKNTFEAENVHFHYDNILMKKHRILYRTKIKKQYNRVLLHLEDIDSFDVIHAHTLFSDGGTAYLLKKKFGLNYVVSIRNTDINIFYKYGVHHRYFIHKVLMEATSIVFISYAYKQKVYSLLPRKVIEKINSKVYIIPNGIDEMWFNTQIPIKLETNLTKLNLLFTGSLDRNKNLEAVINLIKRLRDKGINASLHVAGDGVLKEHFINETIKLGLNDAVVFYGNISMEKLIETMDNIDVFILPSYKETFGISYIEAISRGIPILYTRNEGIDGYFPEGSVGYSITPDNVIEIEEKLNMILLNYNEISECCIRESKRFNWQDISKEYLEQYSIVEGNHSRKVVMR